MELLQLRYLCTAARFENFSRAAKYHNIPQSAISKTIAQLERELGVRLFIRNGNRVTLSESGRRFCREVQASLDSLQEAVTHVRAEGSDLSGTVGLLIEEYAPELLGLVADFRAANPGVTFSVFRNATEPGAAECLLRVTAGEAAGGEDALRRAEVLLLAPPLHPLTALDRVPAERLAGENFVALPESDPATVCAAGFLARAGLAYPVSVRCADTAALCACVGAGVGLAFSSGVSERTAAESGIRLLRVQGERLTYPTRLVCRPDLPPAAAAFRAAIIARLGAYGK